MIEDKQGALYSEIHEKMVNFENMMDSSTQLEHHPSSPAELFMERDSCQNGCGQLSDLEEITVIMGWKAHI